MLLIGPPGSGKTYRVLCELEVELARSGSVTLVVPTASMTEHLEHQLARRGSVVAAGTIVSLARFVERLTPERRQASGALEALLVERAIEAVAPSEFAAVAGYSGFHSKLLETIQEFWASAARPPEGPFAAVMAEFERLLHRAGMVHRSRRLGLAAAEIRRRKLGAVFFDGFSRFTPVELELVNAVAATASKLIVTLPESGAEEARQALLQMGMPETRLEHSYRPGCPPLVVRAPSPEREIEDVAGRILRDQKATGRLFQEYGLILRSPEVYVPIVETVFERFGIAFRASRSDALHDHSAIRFLTGLLRLAAGGFDGTEALKVLKMAGSPLGLHREMDRFEFHLRDELPNRGLEFMLRHAEKFPRVKERVAELETLAAWSREKQAPTVWARRCAELERAWFHRPVIEDGVPHETVIVWRTLAGALKGWSAAAVEAAEALSIDGANPVGLEEYLKTLQAVLRITPLWVADRRRNVVQVLTVYEARQWGLPVVFVCGMVEKQFPRHHPQNLFFPDAQRRRLNPQGWSLRTSADRDREERFLFDMAITRATAQLYLTCPARDESGAELQESFFLEGSEVTAAERYGVRETPPRWRRAPALLGPGVQSSLAARHEHFSPSSLEQYLQCPFLFFAERTLRLRPSPARPEDRIDEPLKGTIIHRTIARWAKAGGGPIQPPFEEEFAETCRREGIRLNFRAEAMKMQLLADLERFAEQERAHGLPAGFRAGDPETPFEYVVEEGVEQPFRIRGRIDRYEFSATGAAVVVDYKYSRRERIQRLVEEHEKGFRVQAPLYLLGLERAKGLTPAGMVFYGLRKEASRSGWYAAGVVPADPGLRELRREDFHAMLEAAASRTLQIVGEIRDGRVEVAPRDRQVCREQCPYQPVCRVEL